MSLHYFAYGSNMLTSRMRKRIPEAEFVDIAALTDWRLVWDKISKDGSAKANLKADTGIMVWGVLYRIPEKKFVLLDKAERGYQRNKVKVRFVEGTEIYAITYVSEERDANLLPSDEYKKLVLDGAQEHSLPPDYIAMLASVQSRAEMHKTAGDI